VLLCCRCDYPCHCKHVPRVSWAQFHIVDEVLEAYTVQNTVGVDEQNEEVIVPLEIFGVDLINELEGGFLTMPLSSMRKPRDRDPGSAVRDVDALWVRIQR